MKNYCSFCFIIFSYFYSKKKYTIPKTLKNYLPLKGQLITVLENDKEGTTRSTYFIDGTKRNYDQFSNFKKRILNGKSESWYKMEIKKRIVLHKGK
jgi:hypothetical protein